MELFAALAHAAKRALRSKYHPLTPAQLAQLKKLDAAIRAEPERPTPHFNRARYLDLHGADFALVLEAVRPAVSLIYRNRKSCINGHYLLEINREDWDDYVRGQRMAEANYWLAYAVASFEVVLERSTDLMDWKATKSLDWDAVAALQRAAKFEADAEELPQTPDELKVLAHALAIVKDTGRTYDENEDETHADFVAAGVYMRALQLQFSGHKRGADFLPAARNGRAPDYKQLAWWNFILELSPDDARLWRERARWLSLRNFEVAALRDLARAIELSPDDPELYEMRAKISSEENWWDLTPNSSSKTADYLRAVKLRIASGQIDGTPQNLRAQGDQLRERIHPELRGHCQARARAFYSLAIAATPDKAALYLARARAAYAYIWQNGDSEIVTPDIAYSDYARALILDETLSEAREGLIFSLRHSARRPTAHEQIEALLEARQYLRDFGMKPQLSTAIVGEVERALAHEVS